MSQRNQYHAPAGDIIRCPSCGKLVQLPALDCPYCRVDLKEATAPKKPGFGFFRYLFSAITILLFLAIAGWLIHKAIYGGPIVPPFLQDVIPHQVTDLINKFMKLFK